MQPRPMAETSSPERPRVRFLMPISLVPAPASSMIAGWPAIAYRSMNECAGRLPLQSRHLAANEIAIGPAMSHQPVGRPVFDHPAGLEHDDAIEAPQGRDTVSNGDDGAPEHQPIECFP